jgi:uncharacterized protein
MLSEELEKLKVLHDEGELSDEEYAAAKQRLLNASEPNQSNQIMVSQTSSQSEAKSDRLLGLDLKTYLMIMHVSQYAGLVVPFAGLVIPIAMWLNAKDYEPAVDEHGKEITNWIISFVIYCVASIALSCLLIGIPLLIIAVVLDLIFPIVGMIAAGENRLYRYPLTIRFLK